MLYTLTSLQRPQPVSVVRPDSFNYEEELKLAELGLDYEREKGAANSGSPIEKMRFGNRITQYNHSLAQGLSKK